MIVTEEERLQTAALRLSQLKALSCLLYLVIPFLHCVKLGGRIKTGWEVFAAWHDNWAIKILGWGIHGPKWTLTASAYLALVGIVALATVRLYMRTCFDDSPRQAVGSSPWVLAQWAALVVLTGLEVFILYTGSLLVPLKTYFGLFLWGANHLLMIFLLSVETRLHRLVSRST